MKKNVLFLVALMSLTSCATIISGTNQKISFTSEPSEAKVFFKGQEKCTTPCVVQINKSLSKENVEFRMPNYPTKTVALAKQFNAATILNVLVGGMIGIGIDAATGSMMSYSNNSYFVDFTKDSVASQKLTNVQLQEAAKSAMPSTPPSSVSDK